MSGLYRSQEGNFMLRRLAIACMVVGVVFLALGIHYLTTLR